MRDAGLTQLARMPAPFRVLRGIDAPTRQRLIVAALLVLGVAVRAVQFLPQRSLHHDEAALGVNLIQRSFAELLQPLDFFQGAPVGFLMVEKVMAVTLGNSDWVLRLVPFLCGIASVFVFYRVALLYVAPRTALVALALFAIGRGLVYYSAELKQYSSDVLIALLLWWCAARLYVHWDRPYRLRHMLAWGLAGAVALWFSHAAVLVLAGTGPCYGLACVRSRSWMRLGGFVLAGGMWLGSFALCHFLFLTRLTHTDYLLAFWQTGFMPWPPRSLADLYWLPQTFMAALEMPGGFSAQKVSLAGVAVLAFFFGCRALASNRRALFALLAPVAVTLAASWLHKYPFADRLILFLVAPLLLIVAAGTVHIWERTAGTFPLLGAVIFGLVFLAPVLAAAGKLARPGRDDQIKPMLQYLGEHRQPGDLIYVYTSAWPVFLFYSAEHGLLDDCRVVRGSPGGDAKCYLEDLDRLRGERRVWLLFCHHSRYQALYRARLAQLGTKMEGREAPGAAAVLYDLASEPKPAPRERVP